MLYFLICCSKLGPKAGNIKVHLHLWETCRWNKSPGPCSWHIIISRCFCTATSNSSETIPLFLHHHSPLKCFQWLFRLDWWGGIHWWRKLWTKRVAVGWHCWQRFLDFLYKRQRWSWLHSLEQIKPACWEEVAAIGVCVCVCVCANASSF